MKHLYFLHALALLLFLSGCTAMKLVPENQVLYTGSEVKVIPSGRVRAKGKIKELLNENILPKPNSSILGMRPGLWFFYKTGNATKGLKKFIKTKLGQTPVYMADIDAEQIASLLKGHLVNNGYFHANVESKVNIKKKKGTVTYTAFVHRPYRLRDIAFPKMDTLFTNIDSVKNDSYLKSNQRYDLERLQAEQSRIEEALENLGFYFFDDRHLIFEGDSTVGNKQVDLLLTLEPGVPEKAKRVYTLDEITVIPDYTLSRDTLNTGSDTTYVDDYTYVDRSNFFRPKVITNVINFSKGKIYRTIDREYTLSHLMGLGAFKFVDIRFEESQKDSSMLNAKIYLTPHMKKSLRAEFQGTSKSNNFVGPGLTLRFTNRNAFRGSERFEVTLNTSYEVQINRNIPEPLNAFELGTEASVSAPRLVSPFRIHYPSRKYLPTTDVRLGFRLQQRIGFFRLNSFNLTSGYTWRENTLKTHELYPIDINYMQLGKRSDIFQDVLNRNPFLARSLENQFIMGARYAYTLNTQVNQERQKKFKEDEFQRSHFFLNATADIAGNLVSLIQGRFDSGPDGDPLKIFGSVYSQYARSEVDFRYYFNLNKTNMIATRLIGGLGYAYGNSTTMPYIKQFSIGGSHSLRAFPARSIGPGTYYVREDPTEGTRVLFIDQRADIKLEGNVEYRMDFTKTIKGALFVDAGNIWLVRQDDNRPGGKFLKNEFLNQLAVGTGLGVRFDFNFFVLRFDLAFPLRKPWIEEKPWVIDEIDFASGRWRGDNVILNIAIGYPF